MNTKPCLLLCLLGIAAAIHADPPASWTLVDESSDARRVWIEAERMKSASGWEVATQSYCESMPHVWSRGKLEASARLAPGAASPWRRVPIRPFGEMQAVFSGETKESVIGGCKVELSFDPDGKNIARSLVIPQGAMSFEFRLTRDPDRPGDIITGEELSERVRQRLLREKAPGKPPSRFPVSTTFWIFDKS